MPTAPTTPRPEIEVDLEAFWNIETDYLRARVRRKADEPFYLALSAAERCVFRWGDREDWTRFLLPRGRDRLRLTPTELKALAADLDARARRLYQLGRQKEAAAKAQRMEPTAEDARPHAALVTQRRDETAHTGLADEM